MLVGIALIYTDSVLWKWGEPVYRQGLGIWARATLPQSTWLPASWLQPLLNNELLMYLANGATLLLESSFLVLMWFRWPRVYLLLPLGMVLHLGIGLVFPIPLFGLALMAIYLVLVPPEWWEPLACASQVISIAANVKTLRRKRLG